MRKDMGMKCLCGAIAKPAKVRVEGYMVRAWKCSKCKEEYLDSGDAEFILLMKKMQRKAVTAKIGVLGDSFIVRIPKEIAEALKLTRGKIAVLKLSNPNSLIVSVSN